MWDLWQWPAVLQRHTCKCIHLIELKSWLCFIYHTVSSASLNRVFSGWGAAPGLRRSLHWTRDSVHGRVPGPADNAQLPYGEDPPLYSQQCTTLTRTRRYDHKLKRTGQKCDLFWCVLVSSVLICCNLPVIQVVYHEQHIQRFWERHRSLFPEALLVGPEENLKEDKARTMAVWVESQKNFWRHYTTFRTIFRLFRTTVDHTDTTELVLDRLEPSLERIRV